MSTRRYAVIGALLALVAGMLVVRAVAWSEDDCSTTVRDPAAVPGAVAETGPGETLCLAGPNLRAVDLHVAGSGTTDRPLTVLGKDDVVLRSVVLTGRHIVLRQLTVRDGFGISCTDCDGSQIDSNTVTNADGSGISFSGRDIEVRDNIVRGSRMRTANDADGIRFFGSGHRITGNVVEDISAVGYAGEGPHPDCFQTFDSGGQWTTDVVIRDNTCRRVGHQCLIVTADQSGALGVIGRSRSLDFVDNTCEVGGSQAVLVRWFPEVRVEGNTIRGQGLRWGAYFSDGSTGGVFSGNRLEGDFEAYGIDESSRPGFHAEDNLR